MSIHLNTVFKGFVVAVAAGLGVVACEQGSPTDPVTSETAAAPGDLGILAALGSTTYPGTKSPGKAVLCKDASSPAGTYNFTIGASPTVAGDQLATAAALTPGTCSIVWERTTAGGPVVSITATETIPGGATYQVDHVNVTDDLGSTNSPGPSATLRASGNHGGVITFFNEPAPVTPHHIVLCKAGNVAGTFTFDILAAGTIASDVVQATANLSAGSCDTVFTRVEVGPVAATVTITESVAANATTFLQGVTVDGNATATVGAGVVVTSNNLGPNKVVVFTNAQATVGATVAYHPRSQTPGIVHLCKAATSPPGTYNFNVVAVGTVATDQILTNVSLTAGQCKVIFIRTVAQAVPAALTIFEATTLGTAIDLVARQTSIGTTFFTAAQAGLGIAVTENASPTGGTLVIFVNKTVLIP